MNTRPSPETKNRLNLASMLKQPKRRTIVVGLTLLLSSLFSTSSFSANECRLKYKAGNSGFQYKNVNKGQSTNLTKSNFKEAYNVGRNDIRLTLQYVDILGKTKTEYMTLIKSGSNTLPLPPIPLINKKLKAVKCQNYAAIIDTLELTQQLGSSAGNLVSQATSSATSAITNAANSAGNLFSAQSANNYKSNSIAAIQSVQNALRDAKDEANRSASNLRTNLSQHFPEVNQAANSTNSYSWQLSNSLIEQGKQNIARTKTEIERLDNKYAVSRTVSQLVKINLAKDFPEINSLQSVQCKVSNSPLVGFNSDLSKLDSELRRIDQKYKFSQNVGKLSQALITIPRANLQKLKAARNTKPCQVAWQELSKALEQDSKLLGRYLQSVLTELKKLKASQFNRTQSRFFDEIKKLIIATEQLIKEHKAQEARKVKMDAAESAHAKAYRRLSNDLGPIQDDIEKFPGGFLVIEAGLAIKDVIPKWLTDDPRRLQQLLTAEINAAKAYRKAIKDHEDGKLKVKAKFNAWVKQSGNTLASGTRLKISLTNVSKLFSLLKKVPVLKVTDKAFNAAHKCIENSVANSLLVAEVIFDAIKQYQNNIAKVAVNTIPEDLRGALNQLHLAAKNLLNLRVSSLNLNGTDQAWKLLSDNINSLRSMFSKDPTKTNFASQIDRSLKTIRANIVEARKTGTLLTKDIGKYQAAIKKLSDASNHLTSVLGRHKNNTVSDIKRVALSAPGVHIKWQQVSQLPQQINDCAGRYATPLERAISSFSSRLQALLRNKVEVAANSLPQGLKTKLKAAKSDIASFQTSYVQFENSMKDASTAYAQFNSSQGQAISSLVPIPQNNAAQKAQDALNKLNVLKTKLATANRQWGTFNTAQVKLLSDINSLKTAFIAQGGELASDAGRLAYTAFNGNLVESQVSNTNALIGKWSLAIQTLPSRLAALATGGLSTQLEAQINQGINWMNSKKSSLLSCVNDASSSRSSILSNSQKTTAINNTIQGLNAQAVGVITSLRTLIPPTPNLLNNINSILNSAKDLSIRVNNAGATATSNFNNQVSTLKSQLNQAKSCVTSNYNSVNSKKTELLNLLN